MTDAPERIWAWPSDVTPQNEPALAGTWGVSRYPEDATGYIRADLAFPQWQPIETAPRDGTRICGFWQYTYPGDGERTYGERVIEWHEELCGWLDDEREVHTRGAEDNTGLFTHWMPLPELPVKVTEQA